MNTSFVEYRTRPTPPSARGGAIPERISSPLAHTTPARTTGLDVLADKKVLAVLDCENWEISAREHPRRAWIDYGAFVRKLGECRAKAKIVAVFPETPGRDDRFRESGICPAPLKPFPGRLGSRKLNVDSFMAFTVARLLSGGGYDAVLIGSGDGLLVHSIVKGLETVAFKKPTQAVTMSLAGNTAASVDASKRGDMLTANIEIGWDMLVRLPSGTIGYS